LEKRLLTALLLSGLVLLTWQFFAPKPPPQPTPPAIDRPADPLAGPDANAAAQAAPAPVADDRPVVGEPVGEASERTLELSIGKPGEVGSYRAVFSNRGARLVELKLANFYDQVRLTDEEKLDPQHWVTLFTSPESLGLATGSIAWRSEPSSRDLEREPIDRALWRMREIEGGVEFDLAQGTGVRWIKRVRFNPASYRLDVELAIENQALEGSRRLGYLLTPAECLPPSSDDRFYVDPQAIAGGRPSEDLPRRLKLPETHTVPREDTGKERSGTIEVPVAELSFAGVHNHYFAGLLRGADPMSVASMTGARWRRLHDDAFARRDPENAGSAWKFVVTDVTLEFDLPAKGETKSYPFALYAGPKDPKAMYADHADYEAVIDADIGSFCGLSLSGVGALLVAVLRFFHGIVGNWGVAIILLTLCVRLVLYPDQPQVADGDGALPEEDEALPAGDRRDQEEARRRPGQARARPSRSCTHASA
jgi:hypothetical protein